MNYLGKYSQCYFPNFAAFASLREIIRVSLAAVPRWDFSGERNQDDSLQPTLKPDAPDKETPELR
ncbi:MAG: hypothetical protein ACXWZE_17995 [Candidatus Binatia bacterium]